MAYKRFVRKRGKIFGPYYYESYRDGDKIKKKYLGKIELNVEQQKSVIDKINWTYFFVLLLLAAASFFLIYQLYHITGQAVIDIAEVSFNDSEIFGDIEFTLKQGELIPADSVIKVRLNEQEKEMALSSLLEQETTNGNYFVETTDIKGYGDGYGVLGVKKIYPDVYFRLKIETFERSKEPIYTVQETGESGSEGTSSESESKTQTEQEPAEKESVESQPEKTESENYNDGTITGQAVKTDFIDGSVNALNDFVYNLEENQQASIEAGSVRNDTDYLPDETIRLSIENGKAVVSTDYHLEEFGFGEEYLTGETITLKINISEFEINAEDGALEISILYQDTLLSKSEKSLQITPAGEQSQKSPEEENISQILETLIINETNATTENASSLKIVTAHEPIKLNQAVKWIKNISTDEPKQLAIELPAEAENITIKSLKETEKSESVEQDKKRGFVGIASEQKNNFEVSINDDGNKEVVLKENSTNYVIEYYTPAPESIEEETSYGKKVIITGPELNYTNILSFTSIPEKLKIGQENLIKIKWVESDAYIPFDAYDTDNNGYLDYVEWITEHLSNQTFEIILITKAEHLDENRNIIEDVYDLSLIHI